MPAIPYKKTSVDTESAWDGPKTIADLPNDCTQTELRQLFAWVDPDGNEDTKSAYKFPHHEVTDGKVGAANYKACVAAIGALNGGRGGTKITDDDRKAVYNHLAHHIKDADKEPPELNAFEETRHSVTVELDRNAFTDAGNGIISFPNGLVITDNSQQRNGTRYDIDSMDLSEWDGHITADHKDEITKVIGNALGVGKTANGDQKAVAISGIQYAVNSNPLALFAYNMVKEGFLKNFSIETFGPWPDDEDNTYYHSKLVGLSQVVLGNNKSARINQVVMNSISEAKAAGLDTTELEQFAEPVSTPEPKIESDQTKKVHKMYKTVKNSRDFAVTVTYKNAAGDEVGTVLDPGKSVDVSEDQIEAVQNQITGAQAPKEDVAAIVANAVAEALKPVTAKLTELEQHSFDSKAKEPEFIPSGSAGKEKRLNKYSNLDAEELLKTQINAGWDTLKRHSADGARVLNEINEINLDRLKEAKIVKNSIDISDFGNFVIPPELLHEIQGIRTDYTPLVDATQWKETLNTQMAWLERSGDIDMQPVAYLDNADNDNLKPISTYTANINTAALEELASVTPVMNAATRFLAADLMGDVAIGYRNDYDRKRAQLVVARLQQAINQNGQAVDYLTDTPVDSVESFLNAWTEIGNKTPNGVYLLGTTSMSTLRKAALSTGPNGPLAAIFSTGQDGVELIFGRPRIVVSDDLLPRLGQDDSISFTVDGTSVAITSSVFYFKPENFTGRTSGGLMYDLSTEAAYEDGGIVKSAYQRNELVLRGSFFRGGAIKDYQQVASISNGGVS